MFLSFVMIVGCAQPFDRTPKGYVEACYGGSENWKRNWVCSERRLEAKLSIGKESWQRIGEFATKFSSARKLEFFDTSESNPGYGQFINLSVCSPEGLFINFDQRLYERSESNKQDNRLRITISTYKHTYDWSRVALDFEKELSLGWSDMVELKRPEPRGSNRALPDSVKDCEE